MTESFIKYLGNIAEPMKNAINPINNVIVRLIEGLFSDNNKNNANKNKTINGLKICFFKIIFLFKKLKKFSLG